MKLIDLQERGEEFCIRCPDLELSEGKRFINTLKEEDKEKTFQIQKGEKKKIKKEEIKDPPSRIFPMSTFFSFAF